MAGWVHSPHWGGRRREETGGKTSGSVCREGDAVSGEKMRGRSKVGVLGHSPSGSPAILHEEGGTHGEGLDEALQRYCGYRSGYCSAERGRKERKRETRLCVKA